ncbi:MAG: peptide-methionine (S)-S-oxide reductase MsrA [Pseudomonadota bacterium]
MKTSTSIALFILLGLILLIATAFSVSMPSDANPKSGPANATVVKERAAFNDRIKAGELEVATFGSGCFWCVETNFDKVEGVVATISGYMGGVAETGNYKTVSSGRTQHIEVLQVIYDPNTVKYDGVVDVFFKTTDVLDGGGQFCDRGAHYRPVIFAHSDKHLEKASAAVKSLDASGRFSKPIAVPVLPASVFVPAEDYHQNYAKKNPRRYASYRRGCGRGARIKELWGSDAVVPLF